VPAAQTKGMTNRNGNSVPLRRKKKGGAFKDYCVEERLVRGKGGGPLAGKVCRHLSGNKVERNVYNSKGGGKGLKEIQ